MAYNKGDGSIQYTKKKIVEFSFADVVAAGSAAFIGMVDLPPGAIVSAGGIMVKTVFNSTSSDTFVIEDSATSPNSYATGISGQSLGYKALTANGKPATTTAMQTIGITWTPGSGTPTTGVADLIIDYYVPDASEGGYYTLSDNLAP